MEAFLFCLLFILVKDCSPRTRRVLFMQETRCQKQNVFVFSVSTFHQAFEEHLPKKGKGSLDKWVLVIRSVLDRLHPALVVSDRSGSSLVPV